MILQQGNTGPDVLNLQNILLHRGYRSVHPDNDFGPITTAAVKDFQTKCGLTADGIVTDNLISILKGAGPAPIMGIDVSYWNGNLNWGPVVAAGGKFAYVQVSQGTGYIDSTAPAQAAGALAAGLEIGYYHFAKLSDVNKEAQLFLSTIKKLPHAKLLPALDLEVNPSNMPPQQVVQWVQAFQKIVGPVILYSYTPFLNANLPVNHPLGGMPLWLAQYTTAVDYPQMPWGWAFYSVWQYSDNLNLGSGPCDVNRCHSLPFAPTV